MDSYAIHQQRPITPPNDRNKPQVPVMGDIQNKGQVPFERQGEESSLSDLSHLSKQNATSAMPPVSTAPSAPSATAASANPFLSSHQDDHSKPSILSDTPSQSTRRAQKLDDPFNDIKSATAPSPASNTNYLSSSSSKYGSGRNDTTHRIESEVLNILKWKNPVRSGSIFALIVGSIILTRWYSLLQIGSSLLTIAIGVNLIYVNFIMQGQKLVSSNQDASHPYNNVIHNDKHTMIDKQSVRHYSTVLTEVSETLIRALTRIVFVENTATSLKWMSIFFVIWKVSAHVSTMDIQRAAFAKAGTTGTDAKNTMSKESVTIKED
ncbi:hypothetical protein V8B55DRAFT_1469926 [Mucor lusitanicus]